MGKKSILNNVYLYQELRKLSHSSQRSFSYERLA